MTKRPIRALVVADATNDLVATLQLDADITVVGQTSTAVATIAFVINARPDIVILDLNLADGSSQQAIEQIMDQAPTPILVLSNRIQDRRSPSAVEALVAGALDALPSPRHWPAEQGLELRERVRRLSKAWVIRHLRGGRAAPQSRTPVRRPAGHGPVVAMAASTGGPSAFASVLADLGGLAAPVLVVQHLHADFTAGLLDWMSRVSALPVEIAGHGQLAEPGHVYLAPGGTHLQLGLHSRLKLSAEPATIHRPSADVLFASVAEQAGAAGVGVVMTGMGEDGANGLLLLRRRGGATLGQDEQSCAVFGMPRAAERLGAVTEMLPLTKLAAAIQHAVRARTKVHQ